MPLRNSLVNWDAPENVLIKDGFCSRFGRACANLPDEKRDVDVGGTGRDAGRVVAEVATVGGDGGFKLNTLLSDLLSYVHIYLILCQ